MYQNASIAHWLLNKDKKQNLPTQVDIDLTNICNQDCYYCISAEFRDREPVQKKWPVYIDLIDKLATWREHTPNSYGDLHAITFPGGGEPTLLKGYEKIIEYSINKGFLVSLTTNGSQLEPLYEKVPHDTIKQMNWVGIDIDSAIPETYELIRKSKVKGLLARAIKNTKALIDIGVNVDYKVLLDKHNVSEVEIEALFKLGKEVNIRMIYFRPVVSSTFKHGIYIIKDETNELINKYSKIYNVPIKLYSTKSLARNYTRCHQMFQFPVFCADGKVYSCCDHKGNSHYEIANWDKDDFRDEWLGEKHWAVYNRINTKLCPPCRGNNNNIDIQHALNDRSNLEDLNT